MTLDVLIMGMGALVALLPFLGFPLQWDNYLMALFGALIIILGIIVRRRGLRYRSAIHREGGYEEKTDV